MVLPGLNNVLLQVVALNVLIAVDQVRAHASVQEGSIPNCGTATWGPWICDDATGMETRTRTGPALPNRTSNQTQARQPVPCTTGTISPWSACTALGESKTRTVQTLTPAKYGGSCPATIDTCDATDCLVNGWTAGI
uniref:CBM1 domain-containing protein n=1 Tax=Globisporangium ultimum (strain ATCC 200006 / CBS 805.95 / DAOM BR144) TaxID=431595 RepID=K3WIB2_GLOUD